MQKLWHYAPLVYLPAIVESGCLRPSNDGAEHERPLVWFSANPVWEPTAGKVWKTGNTVRCLSFREQQQRVGCMRIAIDAADPRLLPWAEACKVAGMSRDTRRALERAGRKEGANPAHWFAIDRPVPVAELLELEIFERGAWRTPAIDDAPASA
jgi:hypothetical protein